MELRFVFNQCRQLSTCQANADFTDRLGAGLVMRAKLATEINDKYRKMTPSIAMRKTN